MAAVVATRSTTRRTLPYCWVRFSGSMWSRAFLNISSFGEDEAGNLYVADITAGVIYKIDVP